MSNYTELVRDNVAVALEYIGEGYRGDYDQDDETDRPLLRLYVKKNAGAEFQWEDVENGSVCTRLPSTTPPDILNGFLMLVIRKVHREVRCNRSIKRIIGELSWYTPARIVRELSEIMERI